MRIAIPVSQELVANHMGKCDEFLIADAHEGEVVRSHRVRNPGHGPGGPPVVFLREQGVELLLSWGMPDHARTILEQWGMRYVLGATGDPEVALRSYLRGTLVLTTHALDGGGSCGCGCTELVGST